LVTEPRRRHFIYYYLFALLGLIVGFALILISLFFLQLPYEGQVVARDLGMAFFISGVASLTLGHLSRTQIVQVANEKIEEIRREQVRATLRQVIPEPVFRQIESDIMEVPAFLHDFTWTLELEPSRGALFATLTRQYLIENRSDSTINYVIWHSDWKRLEQQFPDTTKFTKLIIKRESKVYEYDQGKIAQEGLETKQEYMVILRSNISIPPHGVVKVTAQNVKYLPTNGHEIFLAPRPADGIEIQVTLKNLELQLDAYPLHPFEDKFEKLYDSTVLKRWKLNAGVFSSQGIEVCWNPPLAASPSETSNSNYESSLETDKPGKARMRFIDALKFRL